MRERCFTSAQQRGLLRRRWPRIVSNGQLTAHVTSLDLALPVRDVSFGGFATESPVRFVKGEQHEFQLQSTDGLAVRVRARAAHCAPAGERRGEHFFRTGWEALGDRASTEAMVELVGRVRMWTEEEVT